MHDGCTPARSMTATETRHRLSDWFRRWRSPLRAFLLGRTSISAPDVDDVAQEVFLRLMRYEKVEVIEHPQAYLYRMAANVAAEWSIRSCHRRPHEPAWLDALVAEEQPEAEAMRDSVQAEIDRAIGTLSGRRRQILELFFSEGLTQTEIAQRLGETPRSVRRQLAASYVQLRKQIDAELLGVIANGRE